MPSWKADALNREMELALIEYVERYGPTEKAKSVLSQMPQARRPVSDRIFNANRLVLGIGAIVKRSYLIASKQA